MILSCATENQQFSYDTAKGCQIGMLCSAIAGEVTTRYRYDAWSNVTATTTIVDNQQFKTEYGYDNVGRHTTTVYPNSDKVSYQHNTLGQVNEVTLNKQAILRNRQYRADGQFESQTFGNGITETRRYNIQSKLTQQAFSGIKDNSNNIQSIGYQYDANGNVIQRTLLEPQQYQYDATNRLIKDGLFEFKYDANGNRLSKLNCIRIADKDYQFLGYQLLEFLQNQSTDNNKSFSQPRGEVDRIIRIKEVESMTGLKRVTIWRRENAGSFPRRVSLGGNSVGWKLSEVRGWIKEL